MNVTIPNQEVMSGILELNPSVLGKNEIMVIVGAQLQGPFTEDDLDVAFALGRPEANLQNFAFFESESINNRVPLSSLYPARANITRGSTLNAHFKAVNALGKSADLKEVNFF